MANLNRNPFSIKLKQGVAANINTTATKELASEGEPHWTTDDDQLYIFDGTQNKRIGNTVQDVIPSNDNCTIPSNYQMVVYDTITVNGTLTVNGKLFIFPIDLI